MAVNDQAAIFLAVLGLFPFVMNWLITIHNMRGKKWSSNVPPLGGALIFIGGLISSVKPLALIGLSDPGFWLLIAALIEECIVPLKREKKEKSRK